MVTNKEVILKFLEDNLKRAVYDIKIGATRRSFFRQQRLEDLIYVVIQESVYQHWKLKDKNMNLDLFKEIYKMKDFDLEKRNKISLPNLLIFNDR